VAETRARPAFPCLDGLRVVGALAIVVTHVSFTAGANVSSRGGAYLARTDAGVTLFFVLSGFLLYRPFVVARLAGDAFPRVRSYLWRRALRILPAYWVALTLIALAGGTHIHGLGDVVAYYGLLQIYSHGRVVGGLVQAWSLCTQASFYLFVPLYAWLLRHAGRSPVRSPGRGSRRVGGTELAGVVGLYAIGLAFRALVLLQHPRSAGEALTWLPANLDWFALGMGLAVLSARPVRESARLARAPAMVWVALAGAGYWVVATRLGLPRGIEAVSTPQAIGRQVLYGVTACFLVVPAVFGSPDVGLVRRLLGSRVARAGATVTYGVYLWHDFWMGKVVGWTHMRLFHGDFGPVLAATIALALATAIVSRAVVERPALARRTSRVRLPWRRLQPA